MAENRKDAFYFSHDSNARHDPKILAMRSVYGAEGYGWFWIIVEMLREQSNYKLRLDGKYDRNALAMQMQCDADIAYKFVQDCINEFKLFKSDGKYFWSESLIRRMKMREEKSEKARKAAMARWEKDKQTQCKRNANAEQTHSGRNAIKGKESKVNKKERKDNNKVKYAEFVKMTPEEYQNLVDRFGEADTKRMIEILDNFKGAKGKQYKSDYRAILSWVVRALDEEKHRFGQAKKIPRAFQSLHEWAEGDVDG